MILWTIWRASKWTGRVMIDVGIRPYTTGRLRERRRPVFKILATSSGRNWTQSLWIRRWRFHLVLIIFRLITPLVRLMHQNRIRARCPRLPLLLIGRRKCCICTAPYPCIWPILFIRSSASAHPCTLEHAIGNNDVSDTRNIVNCTQLINSRLCKVGSWNVDWR